MPRSPRKTLPRWKRTQCDQVFYRKRQTAGTCRDTALSPGGCRLVTIVNIEKDS